MSTKKSAGKLVKQPAWTPFVKGALPPVEEAVILDQAQASGKPVEEIRAMYAAIEREERIWINSRYQVNIREVTSDNGKPSSPPVLHLSIKRRDKQPIHDWRDLQRIKNELVGPECEAVEIYPAESRLVDTSNQFHLWVFNDPAFRFPLGFNERLVLERPGGHAVQRPFEK